MLININEVRKGDTILDGRDRIEVKKVEIECCSSFGTHINGRVCYERGSKVNVKPAQHAESKHFEESGLGDLREDYDYEADLAKWSKKIDMGTMADLRKV